MTEVADLLGGVDAILLDFDGPICSVFAGYPAPQVAADLRSFLATKGLTAIDSGAGDDPLEVLRWVAETYPDVTPEVDDELRVAERKAVRSAAPTAYAHDVIVAAGRAGRAVAIVSNNADQAIGDYLATHRLTSQVAYIAGRARGAPELMKPHPDGLHRAVRHLEVPARACAFVGDSVTDIEASRLAGVRPIGYAKTKARRNELIEARAEVVVDTMQELVAALDAV